ncbi:hypothetical protein LUZ60_009120 [Juncus effusus]|nr:hypothetical protein LUZ60_009120 [Juncus effusus]
MTPLKALVALMAMAVMFEMVVSTNYTVGKPGGSWDTSTDYTKWVSDKTFHAGDYLLFTYASIHDVWEVTKDDYNTCSKASPLQKYTGGSTLIELTKAGSRYFFCSTSTHCSDDGQKLEVLVVASEPPSDSPPSPSSSSSSPPPPPSGDASARNIEISAVIALAFGVILMMVVY